ncbi:uncharacterized protein LOC134247981 isoform X4 [Saccostrea cucullata]|uniref:uncharacterized protein LOC134247981 isoform X4 n=1 Tax=Saccostrea cuccullata TaxID=36930 RepID=UPI002ED2FBE3
MIPHWFSMLLATATAHSLTTDTKSEIPTPVVFINQTLDQEMNNLRQQLNQETTIRLSLTRQMYSLVDDMITMKKQMAKMEAKVLEMEKKNNRGDQCLKLNKTGDETSTQISQIQRDLLNLTLTVDTVCSDTSLDKRVVVFNAAISKTLNLERNTPVNVVYDTVIYQTGNVYNPVNGFFTAPTDGLYMFSWATLVAARKIFDAELLVNGKRKGLGNCNNEANPGYENCASTIPVVLKSGDKVNIRTTTANYAHGYNWSNFKGWKVW